MILSWHPYFADLVTFRQGRSEDHGEKVPISIWLVVISTILKNDGLKVNGVGMTSHIYIYEMENNPAMV